MSEIITNVEYLRTKSMPVASVIEATDIIEKIKKALDATSNGVGLAAIQIGIPIQIAVIRRTHCPTQFADEKYIYLINPEMIEANDKDVYINEGCLSFPGQYINTERYKDIVIKNNVIDGDKFREEKVAFYYAHDPKESGNDGLLAIAVQHELDHFAGKLITDHYVKLEPIKVNKKVGRNEPCPCGSKKTNGSFKKYKHCCGK